MSKTSFTIRADANYSSIFHSPGLEPWILGLLLELRPYTMLDIGCGYGFWGFVAKRRLTQLNYVVGLDLDSEKVSKAKIIYDDVVIADARSPPFRERSFDAILAIEVLHLPNGNKQIIDIFKMYKSIVRKLLIVTFPHSNHKMCKLLRELNFETYRYMLRGFVLVNRKGIYTVYNTWFCKLLNLFLRIFVKLFPWITDKGYILAISIADEDP